MVIQKQMKDEITIVRLNLVGNDLEPQVFETLSVVMEEQIQAKNEMMVIQQQMKDEITIARLNQVGSDLVLQVFEI